MQRNFLKQSVLDTAIANIYKDLCTDNDIVGLIAKEFRICDRGGGRHEYKDWNSKMYETFIKQSALDKIIANDLSTAKNIVGSIAKNCNSSNKI